MFFCGLPENYVNPPPIGIGAAQITLGVMTTAIILHLVLILRGSGIGIPCPPK